MATARTRYVRMSASSGGDGTTDTDSGGSHAYDSLATCISSEAADLTSADVWLDVQITDASAADVEGVTISGYTTDATRYISIAVASAAQHDGTPGNGYILDERAGWWEKMLDIQEEYVRISGPAIDMADNTPGIEINTTGTSDIRIQKVLVSADSHRAIYITATGSSSEVRIWNSIAFGGSNMVHLAESNVTLYCYNCTGADCATSNSYTGTFEQDSGTFISKNCVSQNPNTAHGANDDDFLGTHSASGDFNISGDGTAPGSTVKTSATVNFNDEASNDFTLDSSDTVAKGWGAELHADSDLAFSDDIIGNDRGSTTWDAGAHQSTAGGGGGTEVPVISNHYRRRRAM